MTLYLVVLLVVRLEPDALLLSNLFVAIIERKKKRLRVSFVPEVSHFFMGNAKGFSTPHKHPPAEKPSKKHECLMW